MNYYIHKDLIYTKINILNLKSIKIFNMGRKPVNQKLRAKRRKVRKDADTRYRKVELKAKLARERNEEEGMIEEEEKPEKSKRKKISKAIRKLKQV